jgi:ADP-heptose:LPS heptosyltransferase
MVDFGQWPRFDALLTLLSQALFTIGFKTRGQHRHYGYDVTVEHSSIVHEIENYRQLIRAIGVRTGNRPRLRISSASGLPTNNYAVFHLWPGGMLKKLKQWPCERWVHLIEEFAAWGTKVVLTGTRSDGSGNDAIIDCLQPCVRGYVSNVAGVSLRETAAMLAQARLVVSVNTGVMHMAAALGVPLVALHGPTSSRRWGPIGERAIAIDSPLEGCGYLNLGWEHPSRPLTCMECIPYEAVREACRSAIAKEVESGRAM